MQIARISREKTNVLFLSDKELNLLVDIIEGDDFYLDRDVESNDLEEGMEKEIRRYFRETDGLERT
jgi:hypothetical protein